jgi:hypothetical protein
MRTLAPAPSSDTEDKWCDRADEICRAWLAYERARLDERSTFAECVELENDAAFFQGEWDRHFEHDAGAWRERCDPELLKELQELEALGAQPPWDILTEATEDTIYVAVKP